jgi:hypothetical protein
LVLGWFAAHQRPRASIVEVELVWGCCEEGGRKRLPCSSRGGVGLVGPTLCLAVEKAPSATEVVPSRGISLGWQACLVVHSCGEQSPRGSLPLHGGASQGPHNLRPEIGPTIGTARDRGVRTARWKAPRTEGEVVLFAERFFSRGSETCSIVPAVPVLPDGMLIEQHGSPTA